MTRWLTIALLSMTLPLGACQQEAEAPGGGAGVQNSPTPGSPPTELGKVYQRAYVSMANAYIEILQEDYNAALPHAKEAQQELARIRDLSGKTLPADYTEDAAHAGEIVTMIEERNPKVAQRLHDAMVSMTNNAQDYDLARASGAGGGAGTTERKIEGPGVAQPEPPPESRPERRRQEGPNPGQ